VRRFGNLAKKNRPLRPIEYLLIAASIAVAIIAAVNGLGTNLNSTSGNINGQFR